MSTHRLLELGKTYRLFIGALGGNVSVEAILTHKYDGTVVVVYDLLCEEEEGRTIQMTNEDVKNYQIQEIVKIDNPPNTTIYVSHRVISR